MITDFFKEINSVEYEIFLYQISIWEWKKRVWRIMITEIVKWILFDLYTEWKPNNNTHFVGPHFIYSLRLWWYFLSRCRTILCKNLLQNIEPKKQSKELHYTNKLTITQLKAACRNPVWQRKKQVKEHFDSPMWLLCSLYITKANSTLFTY